MSEPDSVVLQLLREELVAWSRRGYERGQRYRGELVEGHRG